MNENEEKVECNLVSNENLCKKYCDKRPKIKFSEGKGNSVRPRRFILDGMSCEKQIVGAPHTHTQQEQ